MPVLVFVLLVFFLAIWTTHAYHFNPLLVVFGYHFYEVTNEGNVTYVLITRSTLRATSGVTAVRELTDYILLDAS